MLKLMPDHYHHLLMGSEPVKKVSPGIDAQIAQDLAKFKIDWREGDKTNVINLPLVKGMKTSPEILEDYCNRHGDKHFKRLDRLTKRTPRRPFSIPSGKGWVKYEEGYWKPIDKPEPKGALIFDFETVSVESFFAYKDKVEGNHDKYKYLNPFTWIPVCCGAFDGYNWYAWLIDWDNPVQVVPFTDGNTLLNWNASYDRAFLDIEYEYDSTNMIYEMMSAWITCYGMGRQQQAARLKLMKEKYRPQWTYRTTTNGLDAVYEFFYDAKLDKGVRDEIVKDGASFVADNFNSVINYCFSDIIATWRVFRILYPEWKEAVPAKYSRYAHLMMCSYQVFFDPKRYPGYWERCENLYQQKLDEIGNYLIELAVKCLNDPTDHQKEHLDMTPGSMGATAGLPKWFRDTCKVNKKFSKAKPFTPGSVTADQVSIKVDSKGKKELSLTSKATPYLLSVTYKGELVFFEGHYRDGTWATKSHLLHQPKNPQKRCVSIFVKDHLNYFESGVISTADQDERVLEVMKITREIAIWISTRKRDKAMYVREDSKGNLVFIPNTFLPTGTATRRCADKHTQARANWKPGKIGTELKGFIVAPKGKVLVGADVAGQETFLMGLYRDMFFGVHGANPFSFTCLTGDKKLKTDIHNLVAAFCGIERDDGKVATYSLMYLAGVKSIADMFSTILVKNTPQQNRKIAEMHTRYLKGVKDYDTGEFLGGLGSDVFNALIRLANEKAPRLPVGKIAMPKSMAGIKDFLTTRGNWAVQALGAVFRDIWLVHTSYMMEKLGIEGAKPAITIHDELWFYVPEEKAKRAVYALQIAHLLTVTQISLEFGIFQIPASYCWLEDVTVSRFLTKDTYHDNTTLSNPYPQLKPIVVTPGELLEWCNKPKAEYGIDRWLKREYN